VRAGGRELLAEVGAAAVREGGLVALEVPMRRSAASRSAGL
jgi:hypothetical protein